MIFAPTFGSGSYPHHPRRNGGCLNYKDRIRRYHYISKRETYISGTVDPDKSGRVFLLQSWRVFQNPTKQSARRQWRF